MEFDYTRWHWAVAPTQSACNGQQEPGMAFNNPGSSEWNYLAHDLDVWTRVTDARDVDGTEGMDATRDWTVEQPFNSYDNVTDTVFERTDEVVENASEVYGPILENATDVANSLTDEIPDTTKSDRVEPNANTSDLEELSEDSQSIALDREGPEGEVDPCTEFFHGGGDGEEHVDPWVNIVDMDTAYTGQNGLLGELGSTAVYGNNDADHQDDTNKPSSGPTYLQGQVGIFTDKNDDGDYDQAANNNLWDDIEDVGSYPMLWDMRLDDSGQPDPEAGCTFGFSNTPLTQEMVWANYGAHTGLVMAVYLEEASALWRNEDVAPFPEGEKVFILESQAMNVLRENENDRVLDFEQRIIDGLQSHPNIPDEADVVYANEEMDVNNAFTDQCSEPSGGFDTSISLLHNCEMSCEGDTIVTGFMGESTRGDNVIGSLGGDGNVPPLEIGDKNFAFPTSIVEWIDVDPFDNNPDRNREESSAPPTGEE